MIKLTSRYRDSYVTMKVVSVCQSFTWKISFFLSWTTFVINEPKLNYYS